LECGGFFWVTFGSHIAEQPKTIYNEKFGIQTKNTEKQIDSICKNTTLLDTIPTVNPQVVGSSPTRGAKENHRFQYESGGFSNFIAKNENATKAILGHFWVTCYKNRLFWVTVMPFYGAAYLQGILWTLLCFPL
jgi:hypothetical protein